MSLARAKNDEGKRVMKLESTWSHTIDFSMFLSDSYALLLVGRVRTLG